MSLADIIGTAIKNNIDSLTGKPPVIRDHVDGSKNSGVATWTALATAFVPYLSGGPIPPPAWSVASESASFTATVWTHYRCDTTAGNITMTLPSASSLNLGQDISCIKIASANSMILSSTSLIDGLSTQTVVGQWDSVTVRSTGTTWDVVA